MKVKLIWSVTKKILIETGKVVATVLPLVATSLTINHYIKLEEREKEQAKKAKELELKALEDKRAGVIHPFYVKIVKDE